jgi:Protein of unknown function (DUF2637)
MNSPLPASVPAARRNWARRLANVLVALVVIAVAAAAFVFSYDGVHAIALLGGMSARLARYYPGLFDAVLVIACVAAVMLRDGRWWARLWAWVVAVVVLAAIGTADVLHAANYTLRHRPTEGIVAAAPVVAVLLAFSLLLTLLRQSRTQPPEPAGPPTAEVPALPASLSAIALPAAPTEPLPAFADTRPAGGPPAGEDPAREDPAWEVPAWEAPTREVPTVDGPVVPGVAETPPGREEAPAPPTVRIPALSPEPEPEAAAPTRGVPGIRYAGSGVPGMAGKPVAEERDDAADRYWEKDEEAGQYAGLVYPAREDDSDEEDDADGAGGPETDEETDEHAPRETSPELDDDAPPFATAPFAPPPRLNRVRSTPVPPAEEEEDE